MTAMHDGDRRHLSVAGGEPPYDPDYDRPPDSRTPAQNAEAERYVLGAMMLSEQAIADVTDTIRSDDYWRPSHAAIHDAIVTLHRDDKPADFVAVTAHLRKTGTIPKTLDALYPYELASADHIIPANASHHAGLIREAARARGVAELGQHLTQLGYNTRAEPGDITRAIIAGQEKLDELVLRFGSLHGGTPTGRHDLSWVIRGEMPPLPQPTWCRRTDGVGLFYPAAVNGLFGDPEGGKTWVAQLAVVEALQTGQRAAMIDVDHNGPNHTAARLLLLGAPINAIADPDRFRYYEPHEPDELEAAVDEITRWTPAVYLLDSLGEMFPMLGVSSNDGDEVTDAMRRTCSRVAATGATVITIDHLPKSADTRASGYAIGSIAKKRMMRGSYIRVEVRQQPYPGTIGRLTLRIEKDTHGQLRKASAGGYAGTFTLDSTDNDKSIVRATIGREDAPITADGKFRPTAIMERVSRFVEDNDQATLRDIRGAVTGQAKHIATAVRCLVDEGFLSTRKGKQGATHHHSIAHYRQAEDDTLGMDPELDIND